MNETMNSRGLFKHFMFCKHFTRAEILMLCENINGEEVSNTDTV